MENQTYTGCGQEHKILHGHEIGHRCKFRHRHKLRSGGHGPMPIVTAYANRINSCMCAVVITHCYSSAAQDYTLDYFVLSYASDNELYKVYS